jgi:hypothetical protein
MRLCYLFAILQKQLQLRQSNSFLFLGLFAQHQESSPNSEEVDAESELGPRLEVPEEHFASYDAPCRGQICFANTVLVLVFI